MSILFTIILLLFLYKTWKQPELGLICSMSLIGFGPLFDTYVGSGIKFAILAIIFLIEVYKAGKFKLLKSGILIYVLLVFVKEFISLALGNSFNAFLNAFFVYAVLLGITYLSFLHYKYKNGDFYNHFKWFIIICLLIQFYRTVFDYTFFGMAFSIETMDKYYDAYQYGSFNFRPSSLEDAIIFSIELSIFMCWTLFRDGLGKKNLLLFLCCLLGLLFTFSRSGLVILIIGVVIYIIKSKQSLSTIIGVVILGMFLMQTMDYTDRFLDIFSFNSDTSNYDTRFNSMRTVLKQIEQFDLVDLVLGKGYNAANAPQKNGEILYYVENYYLTLFINSGIFSLLIFIIYFFFVLLLGIKKNNIYYILILLILLVNCLAASLYANTIMMLLFFFSFTILYNVKINNSATKLIK